jgi:outer membrane lipoprotein carrier protein
MRLVPILLALGVVPVSAPVPLPEGLKGAEKLAALVQRVSQVQSGIKTLTADFEQRRTSRLLASPSVNRGRFYYRAPQTVRWEYESPRAMTVLVVGGVATTYRPNEKRAERVEVGHSQRRIFHFLNAAEPLERLKQYFIFTFRDPGGDANYSLELRPTVHQIKKRVSSVTIEVDRTTMLPVVVGYTEPDGDSTTYAFSHIAINQPQQDDLFSLNLPPDVTVVHLKLGSGE